MRDPATIQKDIGRYEMALDDSIDLVAAGKSKPDRSWAGACRLFMNRIDELRAELARAKTKRKK